MKRIKNVISFLMALLAVFTFFICACSPSNDIEDNNDDETVIESSDENEENEENKDSGNDSASSSSTTKTITLNGYNYKEYLNFSNVITYQEEWVSGTAASGLVDLKTYVRTILITITPLCDGVYSSSKVTIRETTIWKFGTYTITLNRDGTGTGSIICQATDRTTTPGSKYYNVFTVSGTVTIEV